MSSMKANYTVEHNMQNDKLGEEGIRFAVINNYHALNEVGITYYVNPWFFDEMPNRNCVAVFKLKLKQ